jgi:anti-sigma factor RsiW
VSLDRPITEDDLHAHVDGALDAGRRYEVEIYLAGHPEVAARIADYARHREDLRAALAPIAEEPVPPELGLNHLIEARRARFRFGSSSFSSWRGAAAAMIMLGVGGVGGWGMHGTMTAEPAQGGILSLASEAMDSYKVFGQDKLHPVEIKASDSDQLLGWISARLQRPVKLPDLSAAGYRFMGGRLVATPHGPAGMFLYDDDQGTRLAVVMRPMEIDQNTGMSEHSTGAIGGVTWADKGIGYSLVGTSQPKTLHPLADEVRRQIGKDV